MKIQTIYLVRHAQTTIDGRYCGSTNASLSETGILQAKKLGKYFSSVSLDICLQSPMKRAQQTAEQLCGRKKLILRDCPEIREIHFGKWERHNYLHAERYWPEVYSQWMNSPTEVQIPEGESFQDFSKRVKEFAKKLKKTDERDVLVVAHGGSLSVLLMHLLKKPLAQFWKWMPPLASVSILKRKSSEKSSGFALARLHDVSHLNHE